MDDKGLRYRVGRHIATNIYCDDLPMAHACKAEDAQLIVNALNWLDKEFGYNHDFRLPGGAIEIHTSCPD